MLDAHDFTSQVRFSLFYPLVVPGLEWRLVHFQVGTARSLASATVFLGGLVRYGFPVCALYHILYPFPKLWRSSTGSRGFLFGSFSYHRFPLSLSTLGICWVNHHGPVHLGRLAKSGAQSGFVEGNSTHFAAWIWGFTQTIDLESLSRELRRGEKDKKNISAY